MFSRFKPVEADTQPDIEALSKVLETDLNAVSLRPVKRDDGKVGWRIVVSPMDMQLTDFENAAMTVFVAMVANIVNTFDLDFILPMSQVDENMKRANLKDAVTQGKFWWKVPREELAKITRMSDLEESNFLKANSTGFGQSSE